MGQQRDVDAANLRVQSPVLHHPDVVVSGFSDLNNCEGRGNYNLSVASATAGCTLAQQPTAAPAVISGRVTTPEGAPLGGVTISIDGTQGQTAITDATGYYGFADAQPGFYTITPALANYTLSPQSRSFSSIGNRTEASFTAAQNSVATQNPVDSPEYFVRQQYLDFLGRKPDQGGLDFWAGKLRACSSSISCTRQARIDVGAAFFMSDEFRLTRAHT